MENFLGDQKKKPNEDIPKNLLNYVDIIP